MRILLGLTLAGCSHPLRAAREPVDYGTIPTDTVPAFYGRVPRNILMISMDTFRRDHLDPYGDTHAAPFLSALAAEGFTADAHGQCSNWTYAATSCTLAGRYNEEAGMQPQLTAGFEEVWPEGTPFLAHALRQGDFWSVLSTTNGWLGPEWGNTQGYNMAFHPTDASAWGAYEEAREALDEGIDAGLADRWLLHVHVTEPHASYTPPEEYLAAEAELEDVPWDLSSRDEQYELRDQWPTMSEEEQALLEQHLRVRYAGEIGWLDSQIFWMIADMDFDHLLDDTLVVIWTDHGEQFWEHGFQTHAYQLYGEENDGVLLFWSKNILPGSWSEPTSAIDLAPTLVALNDLPVPPEMTGLPLGQAPPERPVFAHSIARLGALSTVTQGQWKLVFAWNGLVKLFDRSTDPQEQVDLYDPAAPSAEAQALWALLEPQVELQQQVSPLPIAWPIELQ